jgi:transcriptional regulator with XRE-family HTH domain
MRDANTANREAVAEEIRALMGRRRVSQTRLAKVLGMSQPSLSNRLTGGQPFDVDELFTLAEYFGVEVTALFGTSPKSAWNTADDVGQIGADDVLRRPLVAARRPAGVAALVGAASL